MASGDSEGDEDVADGLDDGLDDGLADGLDPEPPDPPAALVGDADGLLGCEPPPALEPPPVPAPAAEPPPEPVPGLGEEDGDDVCEGDDVGEGEGVDVGVEVFITGGATAGGTLEPAGRSCCHDQPTDPPAGTVSDPTP